MNTGPNDAVFKEGRPEERVPKDSAIAWHSADRLDRHTRLNFQCFQSFTDTGNRVLRGVLRHTT
eukprot:2644438-Lingulodinium_polyedra.AAC.1